MLTIASDMSGKFNLPVISNICQCLNECLLNLYPAIVSNVKCRKQLMEVRKGNENKKQQMVDINHNRGETDI